MNRDATRFLADTSVLLAAVSPWHEHNAAATGELNRRIDAGGQAVVAGHSFLEAYSSLTRMPHGRRLPPAAAVEVITAVLPRGAIVISLEPEEYATLVASAPERGIVGAQVYDALIAECARKAGVDELLTFNFRHFEGLIPGLKVVVPVP